MPWIVKELLLSFCWLVLRSSSIITRATRVVSVMRYAQKCLLKLVNIFRNTVICNLQHFSMYNFVVFAIKNLFEEVWLHSLIFQPATCFPDLHDENLVCSHVWELTILPPFCLQVFIQMWTTVQKSKAKKFILCPGLEDNRRKVSAFIF